MKKLIEETVLTEKISFTREVYEDSEQHEFVAQLWGGTEPLQPTNFTVKETPWDQKF